MMAHCYGRGCKGREEARYMLEIRIGTQEEFLGCLLCRPCLVDLLWMVTDAYAKQPDADKCDLFITPLKELSPEEIEEMVDAKQTIDAILEKL